MASAAKKLLRGGAPLSGEMIFWQNIRPGNWIFG